MQTQTPIYTSLVTQENRQIVQICATTVVSSFCLILFFISRLKASRVKILGDKWCKAKKETVEGCSW